MKKLLIALAVLGIVVAPGETFEVTYKLKALRQGVFAGDFDVCNPNQDFTTVVPIVSVVAQED